MPLEAKHFRRVGIALGEAIKWDVPVRTIDSTFSALTEEPCAPHPHGSITSERAQTAYDWVMTIAESQSVDDAEKIRILVAAIEDMVATDEAQQKLLRTLPMAHMEEKPAPDGRSDIYVHQDRIVELSNLPTASYDCTRLVRLCEELNDCYTRGSFMACGMLVRAIIDHVPPIFGAKNFDGITSGNCAATTTRSFRQSMAKLQSASRDISDSYLHTQIRTKESVPNEIQVDFRQPLDLLLQEVARILR